MNVEEYSKDKCCGCGKCEIICSQNAIKLTYNSSGFLFPVVNKTSCVDCSQCVKQCSFNNDSNGNRSVPKSYVLKHKKTIVVENSRSGGAFTALSDYVLDKQGVIYGCRLIDNRKAIHYRASTREDRDTFRGSKYIQSSIVNCFESVEKDLKQGLWVLFSGTPCQVDAMRSYLKEENCSKLILVDIICYGVPGNKVWNDYVDYIEKLEKQKVVKADFRNKSLFGWAAHVESFQLQNGALLDKNIYSELFGKRLIIRESCFSCPYKSLNRVGDITIGDAWKTNNDSRIIVDDKGTSLVLVNTKKGEILFKSIKKECNNKKVVLDDFMQPSLHENYTKPKLYEQFWNDYLNHSFVKIIDKYVIQHDETTCIRRFEKKCIIKAKNLFLKIIQKQ